MFTKSINLIYYSIIYEVTSPLEKFFRELDNRDEQEARILANLYKDKEGFIDLTKVKYIRRQENDKAILLILKNNEAIIYHKPTKIFVYLKNLSSIDLETLEYEFLRRGNEVEKLITESFYRKIYLDGNIEIGFFLGNF
ncbi:MAG: hypothetical protein OWQ54_08835 [Sulfolobaceae archaeon]|nr:hypothetical protein [Sulfolobaceae archaeon]